MSDHDAKVEGAGSPDWVRARLVELERSNGSLRTQGRLMGLGVIACLAGLAAVGSRALSQSPTPDVIETSAVILRDAQGIARAELSLTPDGSAQLALRDREQVDRLLLTVRGEGSPGLAFADLEGNRRIVMGLLPDETGTMVFADRGGVIRAVLGMSEDHSTNLVFADNRGATRVALGVDSKGTATVMLPEADLDGREEDPAPGGNR